LGGGRGGNLGGVVAKEEEEAGGKLRTGNGSTTIDIYIYF
jgi:hypothetical protein